jgi:hypothetical protein
MARTSNHSKLARFRTGCTEEKDSEFSGSNECVRETESLWSDGITSKELETGEEGRIQKGGGSGHVPKALA